MSVPAAPAFVCRQVELATLTATVQRASSGAFSAALVSGDAGIGKSRLVDELGRAAERDGALVLVGRCVDIGDGELAYAPIRAALRMLAGTIDDDSVLGPGGAELARLAPGLVGEQEPGANASTPYGKERMFELLLTTLGELGQRRPVVLVIEDLHWSDSSTRDLLRYLVRTATSERLALIATCRTGELDRTDPVRPYLVEMRRDPRVADIDLPPFSRDELAEYVAAITGEPADPAALDDLYARSEGNAFFTGELLRAPDSLALPLTVHEALSIRLQRLPRRARKVVDAISVAGRQVGHDLLAHVTGHPHDLADSVRDALSERVVAVTSDGHGYELSHALLREAAYAELAPSERRELHAAFARTIEHHPQLAEGTMAAAEMAHHWDAAGQSGRALAACVAAATEAEQVFAHPEALRHFQRALELQTALAPHVRARFDQLTLTERAAEAASSVGDAELAVALAERAVELAPPARAGPQHARLARMLWDCGRGADVLPAIERAAELTPRDPTVERAAMLESHARLLLLTGRAADAQAPIDEAIHLARGLGATDIEAAALATRVITMGDRAADAIAAGRVALRVARQHGDADTLMRASINAAEALDHAGEVGASIELARDGVTTARRLGLERVMGAHMHGEIAGRLLKLGRWDDAAAAIDDGLRLAPQGAAAVTVHHTAAVLAAHRGDADAVATFAAASADEAGSGQSTARGTAALAETDLWHGHAAGAWRTVDAALTHLDGAEYIWYSAPLYPLGLWACVDRALRHRAEGDEPAATDACADAMSLLARLDRLLHDVDLPEPIAHRAQAAAELSRLDATPSPDAWSRARRGWERLGFPFHGALCAWREAEARLLAGDDRERASEQLGPALRTAEALAAGPLVGMITALVRRHRVRLDGDADPLPAGLTPRELEVLRLVAAGRTNREIGAELFISAKTVGVHVSHVLAKLGAANRAEAATLGHRLGVIGRADGPGGVE